MIRNLNPFRIVSDQFRPYHHPRGRKFSPAHLVSFALIPAAVGVALANFLGPVASGAADTFLVVFAVVGALMTAFIAIVHAVVGRRAVLGDVEPGQFLLVRDEVRKLEVLRDLYASIAFSVLIQVFAMLPLLTVLFVAPAPSTDGTESKSILDSQVSTLIWVLCSGWVYASAVSVAISFLHVITGVYEILDMEAEDVETELRNKDPLGPAKRATPPTKDRAADPAAASEAREHRGNAMRGHGAAPLVGA